MGFNTFAILAVFIAVAGISVVRRIWHNRTALFDLNFSEEDRALVDQASFFLLLPISVALHELGHAVMIWIFGGKVVDFGYYVFAGYVSYDAPFTDVQHILVAVAGTVVNILLAALAVGVVLLRRPPMRAAYNELLWQFAVLSLANALIFYPLLDFATGMNGDFHQIYFGGVPWLSGLILVVHVGILAGGYFAFKNERFSAHVAKLTGLPPHVRRGFMGGLRLAKNTPAPLVLEATPQEAILRNALQRVSSGWPQAIHGAIARRTAGPAALLRWRKDDGDRTVSIVQESSGSVVVLLPSPLAKTMAMALTGAVWTRWADFPSEDDLVLAIRLAMEEAERRAPAPIPVPTT